MDNNEIAAHLGDMVRAHEMHPPVHQRPSRVSCAGISDPLTKTHCQFQGTPQEQYVHLLERLEAVLDHLEDDDDLESIHRIEECEQGHLDRHVEILHGCTWDDTDSLNDGCPIRYRIYREHLGLPPGHVFGPWAED